jgi:hypothetical protein
MSVMKLRLLPAILVSALCCGGLFPAPLHAEGDDPFAEDASAPDFSGDRSLQARVRVEFVEVSHEILTDLLFGAQPSANDAELRGRVHSLVGEGKAKVVETMLVLATNGAKADTGSMEEFIYATEYEPAELPNTLQLDGKEEPAAASPVRRDFATGPTPTAFETRNLGSILNVEPQISADGKWVHVKLLAEIVHHQGNRIWAEWKGHFGNSPVQMPDFTVQRVNTQLTLAAGRPLLVAVLSPRGTEGFPDFTRKWMVFAQADVIHATDKKSEP